MPGQPAASERAGQFQLLLKDEGGCGGMLIEYNGKKPRVSEKAFVAPGATLIGDVEVGEEASIWFGARLRGDIGKITVGARTSIQDNVVVHVFGGGRTDIGEDVTVAHGAVLHNCTVHRGALIGMNAVVLDNAVIGEQAVGDEGPLAAYLISFRHRNEYRKDGAGRLLH